MSPAFILYYLIGVALFAVPFWMLLPRFGMNKFFAFMCLIMPAGPIILLWLMALADRQGGNDGN